MGRCVACCFVHSTGAAGRRLLMEEKFQLGVDGRQTGMDLGQARRAARGDEQHQENHARRRQADKHPEHPEGEQSEHHRRAGAVCHGRRHNRCCDIWLAGCCTRTSDRMTIGRPNASVTIERNVAQTTIVAIVSRHTQRRSAVISASSRDNCITTGVPPDCFRRVSRNKGSFTACLQLIPQGDLGVMNAGPDGSQLAFDHVCDLFIGEVFEEPERQHFAMAALSFDTARVNVRRRRG